MERASKLLFLYLNTGGGHLAPACAIRDWLEEQHGSKVSITLHNGFEGAPRMLKRVVEDGYSYSQANAKWAFELLYALNKVNPIAWATSALVSQLTISALASAIQEHKPNTIVVFHFLLIRPVRAVLKKLGLSIPVITVVTDPFTAHPLWFGVPDQNYVVFSQELKAKLLKRKGVSQSGVSVFPFALNPKFSKPQDSSSNICARKLLGISPDSKVILIMGGADGIPHGEGLIRNLYWSKPLAHVVMVCGRNHNLYKKVMAIKEELKFENLTVLGYVSYVRELLAIADVVITKCGASTFMEILHSGKIPLVNSYIWEQEKGNMEFICRNGMGVYEPNPKLLARLARELTTDDNYSKVFKDNIARMGIANGTPLVSDFIMGFNSTNRLNQKAKGRNLNSLEKKGGHFDRLHIRN